MGTRYVRGLQGEKRDLLATLKHYAGHSFSEGARNHAPVHLGWRELNDTFLLPFEMAVKLANAGSVMPAYHDVDNESCHASRHLLTTVLREEWGFDGLIVADYIGINLLYQHHNLARDPAEAAAMAFNAGLDIELPSDDCASHLEAAVERGLISVETIDGIVSRILAEKFRLGLFEQPYADEGAIQLQAPATVAVAGEVARQSIVVLENNGVLPLDSKGTQKIALIGPTADDPMAMLCGYSFPVHLILGDAGESASQVITPRAALERAIGADRVTYAQGCAIIEQRKYGSPVFPGDVEKSTSLDQPSPVSTRTDGIAWAADCAKAADVAIVCVGDLAGLFQTGTVGEGSDADSLVLPGVQQQLLDAVVATGTPTVVVLTSGRPYNLGGLEDKVAAFVMAFTGGQEGGPAIVDVLTGAVEPSGRLPLSVPRNVGAVPYFYNHKMKSAGTPIARHFGSRYPFGCGRGYTAFEYDGPLRRAPRRYRSKAVRSPSASPCEHGSAAGHGGAAALRARSARVDGASGQGAEGVRAGRVAGRRGGRRHLRRPDRHAVLHGLRRPTHRRARRGRTPGGRIERRHPAARHRDARRRDAHADREVANGECLRGRQVVARVRGRARRGAQPEGRALPRGRPPGAVRGSARASACASCTKGATPGRAPHAVPIADSR